MRFHYLFLFLNNWDINNIFVTYFKLDPKICGSRKMQIVQSTPYIRYTLLSNAHTCTHAHTHIHFSLSSRAHTQWLLERETAMYYTLIYESSRVYVYAQIGVLRRHGRLCCAGCVPRCVYTHVCTYTSIHSVCVLPVGGFTVGTESRGEGAQFSPFV